MKTSTELRELLNRIDHRGYPAYKDTRGAWQFDGYLLSIDHPGETRRISNRAI